MKYPQDSRWNLELEPEPPPGPNVTGLLAGLVVFLLLSSIAAWIGRVIMEVLK